MKILANTTKCLSERDASLPARTLTRRLGHTSTQSVLDRSWQRAVRGAKSKRRRGVTSPVTSPLKPALALGRAPYPTYPLLGAAGLERAPQLPAAGRVLRVVVEAPPVQVARAPAHLPFLHGRGCHSSRIPPGSAHVESAVPSPVLCCRVARRIHLRRKCPPRLGPSGPPFAP